MTTDTEQLAKEFVIWGRVPHGYETRTETDDDGTPITQLVRIKQTDEGPVLTVIATRITEA